ncbi:MAG: hypothetical protein NDJ90_11525 [Oligoflexia bacterium]|nr:hypothetical protein [Oligoflexia bacterium]
MKSFALVIFPCLLPVLLLQAVPARAELSAGLSLGMHPVRIQDGENDNAEKGSVHRSSETSVRLDAAWRFTFGEFKIPVGLSFLQRDATRRETKFKDNVSTEISRSFSTIGPRAGVEWRDFGLDLIVYVGPSMSQEETGESPVEYGSGSGVELSLDYNLPLGRGFTLEPRLAYRSFSWDERESVGVTTRLAVRPEELSEWVAQIGVGFALPINRGPSERIGSTMSW